MYFHFVCNLKFLAGLRCKLELLTWFPLLSWIFVKYKISKIGVLNQLGELSNELRTLSLLRLSLIFLMPNKSRTQRKGDILYMTHSATPHSHHSTLKCDTVAKVRHSQVKCDTVGHLYVFFSDNLFFIYFIFYWQQPCNCGQKVTFSSWNWWYCVARSPSWLSWSWYSRLNRLMSSPTSFVDLTSRKSKAESIISYCDIVLCWPIFHLSDWCTVGSQFTVQVNLARHYQVSQVLESILNTVIECRLLQKAARASIIGRRGRRAHVSPFSRQLFSKFFA
jgi:hypothetical protein